MTQAASDTDFWNQQYRQQKTGWDIHGVSPAMKNYFDQLEDKDLSILIPGCGNAYEARYLIDQGFKNITLIDISSVLVNRLKVEIEGTAGVKIILGDFFKHEGKYDLIIEQTFFCALKPILRKNYVLKMHDLLNDSGVLAGLLFNLYFEKDGPPFGGDKEEYQKLFKDYFHFRQFEVSSLSIKPRYGTELFIELQKK